MEIGTILAITGAVLAVCVTGFFSTLALKGAGQTMAGIAAEAPEKYGKMLILYLLPATAALYGLLVGFMLMTSLQVIGGGDIVQLSLWEGISILLFCMPVTIIASFSTVIQSKIAIDGMRMVAKHDSLSARAAVMAGIVELTAIFALIVSLFGTAFSSIF